MPKTGDNFQIVGDLEVYYYTGKGKYAYRTPSCYFSYGNPSWGAKYEDGGIKTIDAQIANKIPLLGNMCDSNLPIPFKKRIKNQENALSTNILLDHFSDISHVLSYLVFTLSLLHYFRFHSKRFWIAFAISFISGVLLEFIQELFVVGRSASINDQIHNTIGILIALILYAICYKISFKKHQLRKIKKI